MDYDKLLIDLKGAESSDVGTLLMYYIIENFKKSYRMEAIYSVVRTFGVDFLDGELSEADREIVRSLAIIIKNKS